MVRNAVSKVMWAGRATVFMVGLAVTLALVLGTATTALGATGASFILGKGNSATTPTSLVSTLSKATQAALSVTNKSGGPALRLGVLSGKAPIKVSATAGTATNLSADKLDGKDSSEFLGKADKAADSAHADSADHATTAESATSATSAGDANTLDGQDSTAFLGKSEKATDSDRLDGKDFTDFVGNGAAAGGDLSGTYPNPKLGSNTVGSGNVSDGTLDLADVAEATATAPIIGSDGFPMAPQTCVAVKVATPVADSGDLVLLDAPDGLPFGLILGPATAYTNGGGSNYVESGLCNVKDTVVTLPPNTTLRATIFDDGNSANDGSTGGGFEIPGGGA